MTPEDGDRARVVGGSGLGPGDSGAGFPKTQHNIDICRAIEDDRSCVVTNSCNMKKKKNWGYRGSDIFNGPIYHVTGLLIIFKSMDISFLGI